MDDQARTVAAADNETQRCSMLTSNFSREQLGAIQYRYGRTFNHLVSRRRRLSFSWLINDHLRLAYTVCHHGRIARQLPSSTGDYSYDCAQFLI